MPDARVSAGTRMNQLAAAIDFHDEDTASVLLSCVAPDEQRERQLELLRVS